MKPGLSRLSSMESPGNSKSRFKSFKRSLLSFVRSPSQREEKKQRTSFPTPSTARSAWDCSSPTETPVSTSSRKGRAVCSSSGLPPPPFADPSVGTTADVSSRAESTTPSQQQLNRGQSKRRVLKDGKLLYEWEQNSTHVTMRLPASWTFSSTSKISQETRDVKVLIAPSFLQVGIVHKKCGQMARIEWMLHHTTGGTIRVEGSTWTTSEEHQIPDQGTIITLCKAKAGIHWAYALMHHPREEVQTKLCRPPRTTKQRRPKRQTGDTRPSFSEGGEVTRPSVPESSETPQMSPVPKKKKKQISGTAKKKKKKTISPVVKPEEESVYFQEKQRSGRRSGGEYSFKAQEQEHKSSSTRSTKPLFSDDASLTQHPTSSRHSGEYSMKPSSHSRLNIYGQEEESPEPRSTTTEEPSLFEHPVSPRRSGEYSMNMPSLSSKKLNIYEQEAERCDNNNSKSLLLDSIHEQELNRIRSTKPLSESSLFAAERPISPKTPRKGGGVIKCRLDLHQDQLTEERRSSAASAALNDSSSRRSSGGSFSLQRDSSTFSVFDSPKRFSKPTSRISMEIKTPQQKNASLSSRSILNNNNSSSSSSPRLSPLAADKPKSRISMQLKKRISKPDSSTTILVQSKASKMDMRESSLSKNNSNDRRRNRQSLDFVGHASEVEQAFPHKPYPNGRRSTTTTADNDVSRRSSSLTAYLEKPSTHSNNTSGSQFKSVATAHTGTMAVVVQNTLHQWTAKAQESFSSFTNNNKKDCQEDDVWNDDAWNDDDFLQELEMSYSRMSTVL